jgi:hypothetical protein
LIGYDHHLFLLLPFRARRMMKTSGSRGIQSASAVPRVLTMAPVNVARIAPNSTPAAASLATRAACTPVTHFPYTHGKV